MAGFKPDSNNDLSIDSGGNLLTIDGKSELIISIESSLKLWLSEYEYDTSLGVDYKSLLSNPNLDSSLIDYYISKAILMPNDYLTTANLASYGVKQINSLTYALDRSTRKLTITAEIQLYDGTTTAINA